MSAHGEGEVHHGGGASQMMVVWIGLLILTGLEVFLAYKQIPFTPMLLSMIGLSIVKSVLIVAYFMHLKFERLSLVLTLVPSMVITIALLFVAYPDGYRVKNLRTPSAEPPSGEAAHTETHSETHE